MREELRGGLSYVRNDKVMLTLTALVFVATFLAMPILTLLPAFATTVLASGGGTPAGRLSGLMASQGLGAILGALVIGSLGRFRHMGTVLLGVQVMLGLMLAVFASSTTYYVSLALLFVCGTLSMAMFSTASHSCR
jgi:predicted MFS family arabinose efflux permease